MRFIIATFLTLHGLAHLVGFLVPWRLMATDTPSRTTLLAGRVNVGTGGIRAVGLLWLVALLPFLAAAAGVVLETPWWPTLLWWGALISLVLSVAAWPDSRLGVVINLAILAWLVTAHNQGWVSSFSR